MPLWLELFIWSRVQLKLLYAHSRARWWRRRRRRQHLFMLRSGCQMWRWYEHNFLMYRKQTHRRRTRERTRTPSPPPPPPPKCIFYVFTIIVVAVVCVSDQRRWCSEKLLHEILFRSQQVWPGIELGKLFLLWPKWSLLTAFRWLCSHHTRL